MFRSLSHEEERQGVAGKVEEPLPLPGGTDLRVRGEGCCREVRREDGPNPVYVPHELGVLALHSLGYVEGGEHIRPLPCVQLPHDSEQRVAGVRIIREVSFRVDKSLPEIREYGVLEEVSEVPCWIHSLDGAAPHA